MKLRLFLSAVLLAIASVPAVAQVDLYDNGPTNGTTDGWTINFGYAVSDTFVLNGSASFGSMAFAAWLFPGDVLQSAEVSITSAEFGGTTYLDQVVNFTQTSCVGNQYGYNVCAEFGNFNYVALAPGTYWLTLQNADVANGDPVYWDENSGPSQASQNAIGTIPSESFTVGLGCGNGGAGCGPPSTPEPGTLMLLGSGIAVLAGSLRRLRSR